MGALNGSLTFRSYFVNQPAKPDFAKLCSKAFTPLTVEDDESAGWVPIGRPLSHIQAGEQLPTAGFVALGLRVDRWRLPAPLFRARLKEAQRKRLEEAGKSKLSRLEKEVLQEQVEHEMRHETVPSMSLTDVVWNQDTGRVLVFSHSASINDMATALFEETFGVTLTPLAPYTILNDEEALSAEPAEFHTDAEPLWILGEKDADLFERIEQTRFLGGEFLTWLWWKVETGSSVIDGIEVGLQRALMLEGAGGRTGVTAAEPAGVPEAIEAVRWGKKPARATMTLHHDDKDWRLTLTANTLAIGGLKIPAVLSKHDDDCFFERMDLLKEAEELVATLFKRFAAIRLEPSAWVRELEEIRAWLQETCGKTL